MAKFPYRKYADFLLPYLAVLLLAPLPFFYSCCRLWTQMHRLETLEERIDLARTKAKKLALFKESEGALLTHPKSPDHFYIDKYLESLIFLMPEITKLQTLSTQNDQTQKRLQFLSDGQNRLLFAEDKVRKNDHTEEIEERQQRPVEMNEEDLKRVLSLIEGVRIGALSPPEHRPQLIVKEFELLKKGSPLEDAVYLVQMQLIKREVSRW